MLYWMVACDCCEGTGRVPAKFEGYRIAYELQDESARILDHHFTLRSARTYVRKNADSSIRYYIITPMGRVVE
jgi:hypothetical protein